MIWATLSSRSCFCWLYSAFPPLAAKNIISLISVLAIWWCPCVESSLVLLEEGVCHDQCVLLSKLRYPWPTSFCTPRLICCYFRYILTPYIFIPVLYNENDIFSGVSYKNILLGLHKTIQLKLLEHYWSGHRLG